VNTVIALALLGKILWSCKIGLIEYYLEHVNGGNWFHLLCSFFLYKTQPSMLKLNPIWYNNLMELLTSGKADKIINVFMFFNLLILERILYNRADNSLTNYPWSFDHEIMEKNNWRKVEKGVKRL